MRAWLASTLLPLIALSACQSTLSGEPRFNTTILMPATDNGATRTPGVQAAIPAQTIPDSCAKMAESSVPNRNDCILDLKTDIDDRFFAFRDSVQAGVDYTNLGLDLASLGLSTAGAATGGAAAKTVLAAINTGVTGTKTSISQDILYKTSISLLLIQMEADRAEQFTHITQSMTLSVAKYPMSQARNDLLIYYADGTWAHSLMSLQSKTSTNLAGCQALEKAASDATSGASKAGESSGVATAPTTTTCNNKIASISGTYNYGVAAKTLNSMLFPDGKTIDKTVQTDLETCIAKLKLTESPVEFVYTASEDQKSQALGCLATIPSP